MFDSLKLNARALLGGISGALVFIVIFVVANWSGNFFDDESESGAQLTYTNLAYTARVQSNGDLHIQQNVTIDLKKRGSPWRQLYQTYTLKSSDLTNIEDISVKNLTTNQDYTRASYVDVDTDTHGYTNWDEQAAGTWYFRNLADDSDIEDSNGLPVTTKDAVEATSEKVELGWNIPLTDAGTQSFEINMTFKNMGTAYQDGVYSMWEPISAENQIPIAHLEGDIYYPDEASQNWTWMHYTGNGMTAKVGDRQMHFSADNIEPENYVDFVMLYQSDASDYLSAIARHDDTQTVAEVRSTEGALADQWQSKQVRAARMRLAVLAGVVVLGLLLIFWLVSGARKSRKKSQYTGNIEYFREPVPISPAAAAKLYAVLQGKKSTDKKTTRNALSATMLSLLSKKAIFILPGRAHNYMAVPLDVNTAGSIDATIRGAFRGESTANQPMNNSIRGLNYALSEVNARKSNQGMTYILSRDSFNEDFARRHHLSESERFLLRVLQNVSHERNSLIIDNKDIKKVSGDYDKGRAFDVQYMFTSFTSEFESLHLVKGTGALKSFPMTIGTFYAAFMAFGAQVGGYFAAYMILGTIMAFFIGLAQVYGTDSMLYNTEDVLIGQVQGLARYLDDFSDFRDRGVEDMVLWDRYLVYAAAFGMSEKVAKTMHDMVAAQQQMDPDAVVAMPYTSTQWMWMPYYSSGFGDTSTTMGARGFSGFNAGPDFSSFSNFVTSFNNSLGSIQSDFSTAMNDPSASSGSGSGGGSFGGGGGGGGGGGFGGR
ncbi:DUF2207 domain-containing protein [Alloscardovia criceti]|uniref:DUF2207 domain-containing protein n=1 Tax=Alloscardovia criceti TaxID=356828 RepID=UPI00036F754D|nr:DUF2207 domain-containing protein [Alloscardovia criceti]